MGKVQEHQGLEREGYHSSIHQWVSLKHIGPRGISNLNRVR